MSTMNIRTNLRLLCLLLITTGVVSSHPHHDHDHDHGCCAAESTLDQAPKNVTHEIKADAEQAPDGEKQVDQNGQAPRVVLDRIVARVNGANIFLSDLAVPRINEPTFSLERAILEKLYFQEAAKLHTLPTGDDIEKKIASQKTIYNLGNVTDDEFERFLLGEGFTLKLYKREIGRLITESNLFYQVQQMRIFVTEDEKKAYCAEHPEWLEEQYLLNTAIVPSSMASTPDEAFAKKDSVEWVKTDWLKKSEIGEHISGVFNLKPGEYAKPVETPYGFQIIQLVEFNDKRLRTFDERYHEITRLLGNQKAEVFEKEYNKELLDKAQILYLDPITPPDTVKAPVKKVAKRKKQPSAP